MKQRKSPTNKRISYPATTSTYNFFTRALSRHAILTARLGYGKGMLDVRCNPVALSLSLSPVPSPFCPAAVLPPILFPTVSRSCFGLAGVPCLACGLPDISGTHLARLTDGVLVAVRLGVPMVMLVVVTGDGRSFLRRSWSWRRSWGGSSRYEGGDLMTAF